MSFTIAITGKGGVGKTTTAALVVSRLIARGASPVLAVDADPNTCLDEALGTRVEQTIGGLREEARELAGKGMAAGISKQEMLELKISESLVEADDFDLIAMGRPEGPGCYCYANSVLRDVLGRLAGEYPYVVIDNEAGLENLSRRIVRHVDVLTIVSDASRRGLETACRLRELADEMDIDYGRLALLINRLRRDGLPDAAEDVRIRTGADIVLGLDEDEALADLAEAGRCRTDLPPENPVVRRVDEFLDAAGVGASSRAM